MHLHRIKRSFAAFLSIWFLLVMVEPEAVHSCPVHSGVASGAQAGHAGHHMAAGEDHHSPGKSHSQCSCPGDCAGTTAFILPSSPARIGDASVRVADAATFVLRSHRQSRVEFLLPFAIGPPASAIASI